ncbi:MAG TPA: hypothetical protein VN231_08985 [Allosphingosinicella sp.]|nr:hypothetical protein [Allosphingosinicella sp.]
MINLTTFNRIATAAVGALVISTACVAAAVGPAASAGQSSAASYALQVAASVQADA